MWLLLEVPERGADTIVRAAVFFSITKPVPVRLRSVRDALLRPRTCVLWTLLRCLVQLVGRQPMGLFQKKRETRHAVFRDTAGEAELHTDRYPL